MRLASLTILGILCVTLSACGRYGPPLPPERFAPKAPLQLTLVTDDTSVALSWQAPNEDFRGKELAEIDGYKIFRSVVEDTMDAYDSEQKAPILAFVQDSHIKARDEMRARLKAENKPSRKADVADVQKQFTYRDSDVTLNNTYIYRVVSINQGGVEGGKSPSWIVQFKGAASVITPLEGLQELEESFGSEAGSPFEDPDLQ